jgi:Spy/CpxP family protein refolding chaperone
MKHFLLLVISAVSFATTPVAADDSTASGQTTPPSGSTSSAGTGTDTGSQGQKLERLKQALAALDLTDAQKEQIKQIRASTTAGKERRQQIMAVLTPDQKAKLLEMIKEHRDAVQASTVATANTEDN